MEGKMEFQSIDNLGNAGFEGLYTIHALQHSKPICTYVPEKPGVYLVVCPAAFPPVFSTSVLNRANPYPEDVLMNGWIEGTPVLYIGKAGGSNHKATLRRRIRCYMRFGLGKTDNHKGGKSIWQLNNSSELLMMWKVIEDAEPASIETNLIREFRNIYGKRPFANKSK